ncbi:2312_t:CDS:2, partial [Racocetra persica]
LTDTIARWIKLCLNETSSELTAKDTRVIAAFLAQNNGVELASILGIYNWSSNTRQFYKVSCSEEVLDMHYNLEQMHLYKCLNIMKDIWKYM